MKLLDEFSMQALASLKSDLRFAKFFSELEKAKDIAMQQLLVATPDMLSQCQGYAAALSDVVELIKNAEQTVEQMEARR